MKVLHQNRFRYTLFILLSFCYLSKGENVVFPQNQYVNNVKTRFSAKGDGKTDDTKALQDAILAGAGIVYLPDGIYRVTATILGKGTPGGGPWIYGQSRDGVIIRLDDNASNFSNPASPKAVLQAINLFAGQGISADHFYRQWHNFTVDAGNNAGAIGIRYYSNNSGTLNNVRITGKGKYGLDLGWIEQNGPNLVRDVEIDGFDAGIYTAHGLNSQTLYNISIRNCRSFGILHSAQIFSVENLTVSGTPVAVSSDGMFTIINSTFTGSDITKPAMINKGMLYARNISSSGFSKILQSENSDISGSSIKEYSSGEAITSFPGTPKQSLNLPVKQIPAVTWESDLSKWVCVNDHGAAPGDNQDDSKSFQAAIDAAAASGKTTLCFNPGIGGDPNWYNLDNDVYIHGSVRHLIGLGFARIIGRHSFVLKSDASPVVRFENLVSLAPEWGWKITASGASNVVIDNSDGMIVDVQGSGDVFINNVCGMVNLKNSAAKVWARQWDNEANRQPGSLIIDSDNDGGKLWILGYKTEQLGTKIATRNKGYTEVLGGHIYNCNGSSPKNYPLFDIIEAFASFAMIREVNFNGAAAGYQYHVRETRNGVTKTWRSTSNTWTLYSGGTYVTSAMRFRSLPLFQNQIAEKNPFLFVLSGRLINQQIFSKFSENIHPISKGMYLHNPGGSGR